MSPRGSGFPKSRWKRKECIHPPDQPELEGDCGFADFVGVLFTPGRNKMPLPSSVNNQMTGPGRQSNVVVLHGTRLAYTDAGDGAPVVFLHPTPLDGDYWRPMVAQLTTVRAIIPDLRGHGASELGSDPPVGAFVRAPDAPVLTMAQFAEDILALLDHLKLNSVAFVGCSIGGYVMLELWRRAPERMRGLAFLCSKPQPDAEESLARRAVTIARARAGEIDAIFDGMAQTLVGDTARGRRPEIVGEVRRRMTLTTDALVAVQAGLAARPDSVSTVATIDAPVLAVAGGEDLTVSPAEMEAFRAARGGCEFHVLPHAGHFAAYEEPAEVAALLARWLRGLEFA
jgi:3-oxoadipate enol-lactonase